MGLDPDDLGNEQPFAFHATSADTVSPFVISVRTALGAKPRQLLSGIMSRVIVILGSGITSGGALLLVFIAKNWSTEDAALCARYLAVTSAIMLAACLLACIGPAGRALRINPADALKVA
jgi:ABC-type antimicrobial peptide transport system permease subunit